eukprot:TRINITY_DN31852_c0_g1_i1.p1 TRINITY_DN31852_c0_g1~~TRINITY_DN31852_c0_g1_i1.p1  ORF type:complete len:148 (+),score=25.21 TRINITY_DN31852_c0_g1_i1:339-782(+)
MEERAKPSKTEDAQVSVNVVEIGDEDLAEKECRVCHMTMGVDKNEDIELGCACKADLSVAHKQCAETWFKLKGNRTCEICGSIASNVHVVGIEEGEVVEQVTEGNTAADATTEQGNRRNGQRLLNFLLACIIFAFVISWLCRFSIPS